MEIELQYTQLTPSIVSVTMIMDVFAKYFEDSETVGGRGVSSDRQMNSGSQEVEKSEVTLISHADGEHTRTFFTYTWRLRYREVPLPNTSSSAVGCTLTRA